MKKIEHNCYFISPIFVTERIIKDGFVGLKYSENSSETHFKILQRDGFIGKKKMTQILPDGLSGFNLEFSFYPKNGSNPYQN